MNRYAFSYLNWICVKRSERMHLYIVHGFIEWCTRWLSIICTQMILVYLLMTHKIQSIIFSFFLLRSSQFFRKCAVQSNRISYWVKKNESIWSTRMHPWKWHSEMWISKLHQLRTFYLYILYDVPNRKTPDTFRISEREWLEEENSMQHTSPCCWTRTTFNQNRRVDYSFFFLLGCCYSDSGWLQRRYVFCSCYNGIRTRSDVCVVFWTGAMCSSALHTAKLVTC